MWHVLLCSPKCMPNIFCITSARSSSSGKVVGEMVGAVWHRAEHPSNTIQKSARDILLKCFLLSIHSPLIKAALAAWGVYCSDKSWIRACMSPQASPCSRGRRGVNSGPSHNAVGGDDTIDSVSINFMYSDHSPAWRVNMSVVCVRKVIFLALRPLFGHLL